MRRLLALALVAGLTMGAGATAAPAPLAVVSYRDNGRLIALPVRIGNAAPMWFVLDTGDRVTTLDAATARRLRVPIVARGRGSGAGHGTFVQDEAAPLAIAIGPLRVRIAHPDVIDLHAVGSQEPEAGLVGVDVLRRFVVRIDPIAHTLTFWNPTTFRYRGGGTPVALSSPHDRLFVTMRLAVGTRAPIVRRMRVDTGSEDAASDDLVRASPIQRRSLQGVGLGTPYVDVSGVFRTVQIGPYAIHDAWGASNDHPAVGMEILRRFTMTFDVPAGRLYLEPNAHLRDPVPAPGG